MNSPIRIVVVFAGCLIGWAASLSPASTLAEPTSLDHGRCQLAAVIADRPRMDAAVNRDNPIRDLVIAKFNERRNRSTVYRDFS